MDFIELLFALLAKFVPLDTVKLTRLENDGKKWYAEIDPEAEDQHPLVRKLKTFGEMWYSQVAMAISFIFLQRVIFDFLNPSGDEDEDDD